jgi:hypothetical protein
MPDHFLKDPSAVLDYQWDWAAWLTGGETIASCTVTVPTGITLDTVGHAPNGYTSTTTTVTAWLTGGTDGTTYTITCQIVTSAARTDERSITVTAVNL